MIQATPMLAKITLALAVDDIVGTAASARIDTKRPGGP
jgi:hypothetical protein